MSKMKTWITTLLISTPLISYAYCQAGTWSYALRLGGSLYSNRAQKLTTLDSSGTVGVGEINGNAGFMLDAKIGYAFCECFTFGFETDWEYHQFTPQPVTNNASEVFRINGIAQTVSVLAYLEFRPFTFCNISPYLTGSFGENFNWVGPHGRHITTFNPNNSTAARGGVGFDYLLANNVTLNFEGVWNYNQGQWRIVGTNETPSTDTTTARGTYNFSSISILGGFRFFY